MRKAVPVGAVVALALSIGASASGAAAMRVRRGQQWAPREYWQWDNRPIWDNPWRLRPNFWGSPEPYLVPANIWARKWHPPQIHPWIHPSTWYRHGWAPYPAH